MSRPAPAIPFPAPGPAEPADGNDTQTGFGSRKDRRNCLVPPVR
jgi:hypothetical protein